MDTDCRTSQFVLDFSCFLERFHRRQKSSISSTCPFHPGLFLLLFSPSRAPDRPDSLESCRAPTPRKPATLLADSDRMRSSRILAAVGTALLALLVLLWKLL